DLLVLEIRALVDVGLVRDPRRRIKKKRVIPTGCRDGTERDHAGTDQLPVSERVWRLGEAAAETDDRNVQTASGKTAHPLRPFDALGQGAFLDSSRTVAPNGAARRKRDRRCAFAYDIRAAMKVLLTG